MTLLRNLLAKDLRRARRNPAPWLISLLIPFIITAIIGLAFGPRTGGGLSRINLAIVDEDKSALSRFISQAYNQNRPEQRVSFNAEVLDRQPALARLTNNEISAVVVLPAGLMSGFLDDAQPLKIEVIKNPAQGIPPAIVEEMTAMLISVLNAGQRIIGDDLREWRRMFEGEDFDFRVVGAALERFGERLGGAREYLFPPLVTFTTETRPDAAATTSPRGGMGNMFGFLLVGMAAMFLLFLSDHGTRDLYRESRAGTLMRFRTLRGGLVLFITSKIALAMTSVLIGALVLFGGGALIFQITWPHPLALAGLTLAYALFAAGIMGVLAALAGAERRADILNTVTVMVLSMAGGCMFPPEMFPKFLRESITPAMPTAWYAEAARKLLWAEPDSGTLWAALQLAGAGVACALIAAWVFRRRLEKGATIAV